jgi:hypothetical protein
MMSKKNVSKGKEVTEADIEALAAEAEAGYDIDELKKRVGRPAMGSAAAEVFPVRLDPELRAAIEERAIREHKNASEIIREALRKYVA